VEILQQERTALSDTLSLVGMGHGDTIAGSVDILCLLLILVVVLDIVVDAGLV